jgi:hypothetical protein
MHVRGEQGLVQAEAVQQLGRIAGVLARHGIDQRQHMQGTQANVGNVANWRSHHV